jgi:hypothetical protein
MAFADTPECGPVAGAWVNIKGHQMIKNASSRPAPIRVARVVAMFICLGWALPSVALAQNVVNGQAVSAADGRWSITQAWELLNQTGALADSLLASGSDCQRSPEVCRAMNQHLSQVYDHAFYVFADNHHEDCIAGDLSLALDVAVSINQWNTWMWESYRFDIGLANMADEIRSYAYQPVCALERDNADNNDSDGFNTSRVAMAGNGACGGASLDSARRWWLGAGGNTYAYYEAGGFLCANSRDGFFMIGDDDIYRYFQCGPGFVDCVRYPRSDGRVGTGVVMSNGKTRFDFTYLAGGGVVHLEEA